MRAAMMIAGAIGTLSVAARLSAQTIVVDHNGIATPACCAWNVYGVGWFYSPTTTVFLSAIDTRFGRGDPLTVYAERTVTVEIRTAPNGIVLGSSSFQSSASGGDWVGGPLGLNVYAGTTYFIDFLNVAGVNGGFLGVNALAAPASGEFSGFEFGSTPTTFFSRGDNLDPIIRLVETTATPEPASLTLMATGLFGLGGWNWRRKRNMSV